MDIIRSFGTTPRFRRHHERPSRSPSSPEVALPEFSELFALSRLTGLRPALDTRVMRLEDEMSDGRYPVRAEMPGIDPARDIDITVRDGQLSTKAGRTEARLRWALGILIRLICSHRVAADGADEDSIEAAYDKGILSVSVAVSEPKPAERTFRSGPPTNRYGAEMTRAADVTQHSPRRVFRDAVRLAGAGRPS